MGIGELFSKAVLFIKSHLVAAACVCGAVFIVLMLLVVLALVKLVPEKQNTAAGEAVLSPPSLSPEDFFMPPEPDFVPPILLEREPRDGWSEEDARPFWTDPMEENAGTWRRRIKEGVDELLENVP
ncbi:MAG: hypothetical protein LBG26_06400 [Treponema sp.]|jgi:hypothetical protein|nr:hypothetical protein [Treponema sp.]